MLQQCITLLCSEIHELLLQVKLQTDLSKVCTMENSFCKVAPWVSMGSQAGLQEITVLLKKECPVHQTDPQFSMSAATCNAS
jgi:hypothetical protein